MKIFEDAYTIFLSIYNDLCFYCNEQNKDLQKSLEDL